MLFDYDADAGRLTARQTISTLPPGFAGSNFCSEILVSADGRFVYAGNRLHDSIGIFSVGADGELTYVGEEWTRGNYPAELRLRPDRRVPLLLQPAGGQRHRLPGGSQDRRRSRFTGHYAPVGNPSCIVFLDLTRRAGTRYPESTTRPFLRRALSRTR